VGLGLWQPEVLASGGEKDIQIFLKQDAIALVGTRGERSSLNILFALRIPLSLLQQS
jgi:hypothetical protein